MEPSTKKQIERELQIEEGRKEGRKELCVG
jgi:hypothetical protein